MIERKDDDSGSSWTVRNTGTRAPTIQATIGWTVSRGQPSSEEQDVHFQTRRQSSRSVYPSILHPACSFRPQGTDIVRHGTKI